MISPEEKIQIKSLHEKNEGLPPELKVKLLELVKSGEQTIFNNDSDYLCCDLGIDQPDRYQWTTFETCRALGGRAADNSKCGH